eukprot:4972287-Prymnesium_polylepis.1
MWRDFYPNATIYGIDAFKGIEGYMFHGKHQKFPHPRAFLESWQRGDQGARIELIQADENIDAEMDHAHRMLRALLRNSSRLTGELTCLPAHSPRARTALHAQPSRPHSPARTAQPRGDVTPCLRYTGLCPCAAGRRVLGRRRRDRRVGRAGAQRS